MAIRIACSGGRAKPLVGGALAVLVLAVAACAGDYPQSTLHPTGSLGGEIDALYRTIFWWAVGVFVVVESALLFVVIRYRERPDSPAPAHVHGSTLLEIGWTLAPAVVLIFIAVPTIQTIFRIDGSTPSQGALWVEVTGYQWWWRYHYPEYGVTTANEMHIPVGDTVVLEMTSADVIHSFWAPKLGGKRDVIPNRTTRIVFAPESVGVFLGQCAEFCGESHANMRLRVIVDDSTDFASWIARQQAPAVPVDTADEVLRRGAQVFLQKGCPACHTIAGVSAGVIGPNLSHVGSRSTIAAGILPNTPEGLSRWLADPPVAKPGSLMPKFPMTDQEIAALVAFLQSLQ